MIAHLTNSLTLRVDRQSQALLVRLVQTDRSWPIPLCLLSSVTGEATVRKSMSGSKLDSSLCWWHLDLCISQRHILLGHF